MAPDVFTVEFFEVWAAIPEVAPRTRDTLRQLIDSNVIDEAEVRQPHQMVQADDLYNPGGRRRPNLRQPALDRNPSTGTDGANLGCTTIAPQEEEKVGLQGSPKVK